MTTMASWAVGVPEQLALIAAHAGTPAIGLGKTAGDGLAEAAGDGDGAADGVATADGDGLASAEGPAESQPASASSAIEATTPSLTMG
jgi:hypothetical protein